jgi:alpha-2-macroglobulin
LYGYVEPGVKTFIYRIKATNTGSFVVPPTFAESMYDRSIQARSLGGKIVVEKP